MSIAYNVSTWNRRRKWNLFNGEISPTVAMRVLDVGFTEEEYSDTDNFIEKYYPHPEMLTALSIETPIKFKERYPKVTTIQYEGGTFPFKDKTFDVCWSNAVIEHVGNRGRQLAFINEIRRVAKRAFITTPNRYFPVEVHTRVPFLHWFGKKTFDRYITLMGKEWAAGEYMYLLSLYEMKSILSDAGIRDFKVFRNRIAGLTLDFVFIF
jgi:SAM-dependent methyltransferase